MATAMQPVQLGSGAGNTVQYGQAVQLANGSTHEMLSFDVEDKVSIAVQAVSEPLPQKA